MTTFSHSCEEGLLIGQDLDLRNRVARLAPVVMVISVPKLAIGGGDKHMIPQAFTLIGGSRSHLLLVLNALLLLGNVDDSLDLVRSFLEITALDSASPVLVHLILKIVVVDVALVTAVRKAAIVLQPIDLHDLAAVATALERRWAFGRVEVVHVSVGTDTDREQVTSVTETDFAAILHLDRVVVRERAREHVVEHELVADGGEHVEPTRVEGHG